MRTRLHALLLLVPAAACTSDMAPAPDRVESARDVTDAVLEAAGPDANWLTYGGNYAEDRFSTLDDVTRDNVDQLGLAWTYDIELRGGVEATPLVVGGVMYISSPWSVVHAIDTRTGERLWRHDPGVPRIRGRLACCDVVNRGVALYEGKVIVGTIDGRLIALDAETGRWSGRRSRSTRTRPIRSPARCAWCRGSRSSATAGPSTGCAAMSRPTMRTTANSSGARTRCPGTRRTGSSRRPWRWRPRRGAVSGGSQAGAEPRGTRSSTTRTSTSSSSEPETVLHGPATSGAPGAATISSSPRSSRSARRPANTCGISRRRPAITGTTRPSSR